MPATQPPDSAAPPVGEPASAQWLSPAEQQAWRAFLAVHRAVFAGLEARLQSDSGMPLAYYSILVTLAEAPGRTLRMGELAAQLHASPSSTSHAITRLESWGWIDRRNDPTDRRAQLAVLTDEGLQALADAAPGHVAAVREYLFAPLTPEQITQLRVISETVTARREETSGVGGQAADSGNVE
jgi:DNA-binding MarR family transcriptional regulator